MCPKSRSEIRAARTPAHRATGNFAEAAAGLDARLLRLKYGQDLAIIGNVDSQRLAAGRREIREELESKVPVLRCKLLDEIALQPADYRWKSDWDLLFAQAPGIEWLHVQADCLDVAHWRAIAADGSVAPPH